MDHKDAQFLIVSYLKLNLKYFKDVFRSWMRSFIVNEEIKII